jgi:uncharacterized membrane protein
MKKFTVVYALCLAGGLVVWLATQRADASYRAVVLPLADTDSDLEARGVSDDGTIVGMILPRNPDITPKPVLWWPVPDWPSGYSAQVYALAAANGATPLAAGEALGIDALTNDVIGYVRPEGNSTPHAFYQTRVAGPPVLPVATIVWQDLHPALTRATEARGADGGVVVGAAQRPGMPGLEAALWTGNPFAVGPGHYLSLHPFGWHHSAAEHTNGAMHVGGGGWTLQVDHALVWFDNHRTPTDLHPVGYTASHALGIDRYGNRIAGWAAVEQSPRTVRRHAMLWDTQYPYEVPFREYVATDLHPGGMDWSAASGVAPGVVAGVGDGRRTGGETRALVWGRGHGSELDLHQFLPPAYVSSEAVAVNHAGVIVGSAYTMDGYRHAVAWVPVDDFWITHDEPVLYKSALSLLVSATGLVTLAVPVPGATSVLVRSGTSSQTVLIPAGQFTGRFRLSLRFSTQTAGTSRWEVSGALDGTVRHATLTLIRQASMPSPLRSLGHP